MDSVRYVIRGGVEGRELLRLAKREAVLESFNRGDIQPELSDGRCPLWPAIIDNQP